MGWQKLHGCHAFPKRCFQGALRLTAILLGKRMKLCFQGLLCIVREQMNQLAQRGPGEMILVWVRWGVWGVGRGRGKETPSDRAQQSPPFVRSGLSLVQAWRGAIQAREANHP